MPTHTHPSTHTYTRTYIHMHANTHLSKKCLCCSGNINRPLEAILKNHWRGIKHGLLSLCQTLPDKQTKQYPNKTARQRITQSTCKLISSTCKEEELAGEQEGKEKVGRERKGGGQEKTVEESNHRLSDLIFRPCLCLCMCEGGVVGIMGFYLTSHQRKLPTIETPHVKPKG